MMYGQLCAEFYDADKKFASTEELQLYKEVFIHKDLLFEPMCGSGRLLIPLLQLGYQIHGLDSSPVMLNHCRQRAQELHLNPVLYQGSIETWSTPQQYQGIIIPFGSFQLLYPPENAYAALEKFKRMLTPGGKLIIDTFVPWEALYENGAEDVSARKIELPSKEWIEIHNHTTADKYKQHLFSKIHYTKYSNNKIVSEEDEQMNILWYYEFEMALLLEKFGFKDIKRVIRSLNGSDYITFIATVAK